MWSYFSTVHSGRMTPLERAICAAIAMAVMSGGLALSANAIKGSAANFGVLDIVLGATSAFIASAASGFGLLARAAIGLLVVAPLDQITDMLLGREDAFKPAKIATEAVVWSLIALAVPHIDLPQRLHDWARSGRVLSRVVRWAASYAAYTTWVLVFGLAVAAIAIIISWFLEIAFTGKDGSENHGLPERIAFGAMSVSLASLVLLLYAQWKQGWPAILKHLLKSFVVAALIAGFFTAFLFGNVIWGASLRPESASVPTFTPFAQLIDEYLKSRAGFVFEYTAGGIGGTVFLLPFVALCWHFWDDARTKGRHSYAVSAVILALLLLICGTVGAMAAEFISYLWGGLKAIGSMTWLGRAVGVGVALFLAWRIIIVPWPREVPVAEFPEKERPRSILPPHVAEAVRQARTE